MNLLKAWLSAIILLGGALPAPPTAEGEVHQAIRRLAAAENFSWIAMSLEEQDRKVAKVDVALEGKWSRRGWCQLTDVKSKNGPEAFVRGDRIAVLLQDGWTLVDVKEPPAAGGKPDKAVRQARQLMKSKSPLEELNSYLGRIEDLALRENGLYSGRFATLDVPVILERAQAAGHQFPDFVEPAARINFRIQDGVLASFELVVSGREAKDKKGQPVQTLLALSVDFSSVGTTALEIPEEVRKLLE